MPTAQECLARIKEASQGELTDEELEALLEELIEVHKNRIADRVLVSTDEELAALAEELISKTARRREKEKANRLRAMLIGRQLDRMANTAQAQTGDVTLAIVSQTVGSNRVFEGSRASVDYESKAIFNEYIAVLYTKLRDQDLLPYFNSREAAENVAHELAAVQSGQPARNATARKIAEIMDEVDRAKIVTENRAGADVDYLELRVARTTHHRQKMLAAGFEEWRRITEPLVDFRAMRVNSKRAEGVLRDIYDSLTTGAMSDLRAGDEADHRLGFTTGGDIVRKLSAERRLKFRADHERGPAGAWLEYNEAFGTGNFIETWVNDLQRSAQNTALMRKFGHRPLDTYRRWIERIKRKHPDKVDELNKPWVMNYFREIDGSTKIDAGETLLGMNLAAVGRNLRAFKAIAALGGAGPMALLDAGIGMSFIRYFRGGGLMGPLAESFGNTFRGMASRDVKRVADRLGIGHDMLIGEILQRFDTADTVPGALSRGLQLFFKLNLLTPITASTKRGMGGMLARDLATLPKQWDKLPVQWRNTLSSYGLDAQKWELAQSAVTDFNGKKVMIPGVLADVTDSPAFSGLGSQARQRLIDDTRFSLATLVSDVTSAVTLESGARERAMFLRGTSIGTIPGELLRFAFQFKGPAVAILTRVIARQQLAHGAPSVTRAILRGEGDLLGLAALMSVLTISGMMLEQFFNLAAGRELAPWDEKLLLRGFVRGGSGGIYTDFLLGEYERYNRSLIQDVVGPVPGTVNDVWEVFAKAKSGGDVGQDLVKLFRANLVPDFFYTQAAIDYLLFYQLQEMANPGYLQRMEQGFKSKEQEYFIPPSQTVPYGGGDRVFEGVR